jgi:nitroreductase
LRITLKFLPLLPYSGKVIIMKDNELAIGTETLRTIHSRRSIRTFTDNPVPNDTVLTLLQAANAAPSAHNLQAWRFIVIRDKKKHEIVELIQGRSADFPRPTCALLRMACRTIISAPVVIAVANTGELIRHGRELFAEQSYTVEDFFRTMEIQSSAAAVENILLAAKSMGLDSVWLGIMYLIKNEMLRCLGEPEGEFMAVVPIGYAARPSKGPPKRSLEVAVRYLD